VTHKTIPANDVFREWRKDPEYMREYEALDEEFTLASELIGARRRARMSQAEVAEAMGTTQAAIARLEKGTHLPSTRTLQRFAKATNTKLRIRLEQEPVTK